MIFQKAFYHFIPGMFQGLVHGKGAAGNACGTGELLILVNEIQIHS